MPFLFPEHTAPMRSFHDEWTAFALATAALLALAPTLRAADGEIPELSVWLAALAAWLAVQALVRAPAYVQLPLGGIAYLLLAAALAWLGQRLAARFGTQTLADALASVLLAGAAANAAIGIVQFYGVPRWLSGIVGASAGHEVLGHVGQRNLFADYLALGQASLLYLVARGRLGAAVATGGALLLALGSAYSQSRSGLLFSLWLGGLAFLLRGGGEPWRRLARHAALLAGAVIAFSIALPRVHEALGFAPALFAVDRLLSGYELRLAAWALAWALFAASPWLGVGWGEFPGAAFAHGLPPAMAAGPLWNTPHNVLLQVLAEAGIVGGALVLALALRGALHARAQLRRAPALATWWSAAVAGIVCLHALVEEPLSYAHFLALLALVAGTLSPTALTLPRAPLRFAVLALAVAACGLLAWTLADYQRIARSHMTASGRTLATRAQVDAARADLRVAAHGPLGALVAPWLYAWSGGDASAAASALRRSPTPPVLARHAGQTGYTFRR